MTTQSELVSYRREKARETLQAARILLEAESLFSAVNRTYYAVFYEVIALLSLHGLSSSKHSGVRALFNEHFVKPGIVSVDSGRFYSKMFEFRQKSDYEDFIAFDRDKVAEWVGKAEIFIDELEAKIEHDVSLRLKQYESQ
jgi:uncharacterized protein (UPF0332 family)